MEDGAECHKFTTSFRISRREVRHLSGRRCASQIRRVTSDCWMDVGLICASSFPRNWNGNSLQGHGVMRLLAPGGTSARAWMDDGRGGNVVAERTRGSNQPHKYTSSAAVSDSLHKNKW